MHILFSGDSPTVNTGFGIVSKNLIKRFIAMGHKVTVLGINFFGEPYDHEEFPYDVYPCDKGASTEQAFGLHKLWAIQDVIKADLIFFLNDPWIIDSYIGAMEGRKYPYTKIMAYYPTDGGPLKKEWLNLLNKFDAQVCYSKFAESIITESNGGEKPKNLYQIYHGIDPTVFKPVNQSIARSELGLPADSFIVGMVARNQFRKRFDILAKAFDNFSKDKPEAKLYFHTVVNDIGYDIADLSKQFNFKDKLILTEQMSPAHGVPEPMLNLIYNSFDINCLISLGDGFGLPVAESMATGCAQLVSDHSCLKELVDGHGGLTAKTAAWIMNTAGFNTWGGITDVDDLTVKLNILYTNRTLRLKLAEDAYNFIRQDKFTWDFAANEFNKIIKSMFHLL